MIYVIFNGKSSSHFINYNFDGPVFGCNFAYRDFPITHLYAVDRITVAHIVKDKPNCECWTKKSPLPLPPGWQHATTPGIDSGSFALEQAYLRFPDEAVTVIGADGILGTDHTTRYEYTWRNGHQPNQNTHERHKKTVIELLNHYNNPTTFICNSLESINKSDIK